MDLHRRQMLKTPPCDLLLLDTILLPRWPTPFAKRRDYLSSPLRFLLPTRPWAEGSPATSSTPALGIMKRALDVAEGFPFLVLGGPMGLESGKSGRPGTRLVVLCSGPGRLSPALKARSHQHYFRGESMG